MKLIPLTQGFFATVDDEDFDRANQFKWYAFKSKRKWYACRGVTLPDGRRTVEYLHNFILGIKWVDHRDGDGLNNRQENLRPATNQQNVRARRRKILGATSQYRGVSWESRGQKWKAAITVDYQSIWLGYHAVEEDAARAYDAAARERFGEFAAPNFPVLTVGSVVA